MVNLRSDLAFVIGLVPASILTRVGLPLVPIILLAIFALWLPGYLLGTSAVSTRVWMAFSGDDQVDTSMARNLMFLAAGLVALAELNFIPIVDWLINLAVMFPGLDAIALLIMERLLMPSESAFSPESEAASVEDTGGYGGPTRRRPPA